MGTEPPGEPISPRRDARPVAEHGVVAARHVDDPDLSVQVIGPRSLGDRRNPSGSMTSGGSCSRARNRARLPGKLPAGRHLRSARWSLTHV
jgi:hypothetical protein